VADIALLEKWLRGPRLKIVRANQHINEFKSKAEIFLARHPYQIMVEENLGEHRVKWPRSLVFHIREEIPEEFSAIIGDAVHNLRSALDLLLCAMVRGNGRSDKRVQFPVARNANALDEAIEKGNVARGGPTALKFVRDHKPYRGDGGNWAISAIHDLDILDKHRLIIAIGSASDLERAIVGLRWESSMALTMPGYKWTGLEDGAKLLDIQAEAGVEIGDEVHAAFSIAFGNRQPAGGLPVIDTLSEFANYIGAIVNNYQVRDS
jgi:hypothetical protein